MEATNNISERKPGRPFGSLKYVDDQGKPCSVYVWRKAHPEYRKQYEKQTSLDIRLKVISEISGKSKQQIIQEALSLYLAQKLK